MYSPWRGVMFKAYKITDIFSRQIVGWRVEDRESDHLATQMFQETIATHGTPRIVHADNGSAMTSNLLRDTLKHHHGIELSYNRPYVSNDNPFSEAGFRTMKYRPDYPKVFTDLQAARDYLTKYVTWYNQEHKHSGIALFTPAQVHNGTWHQVWHTRNEALQRYYQAHPERFKTRPTTPTPPGTDGINHPTQQPQTTAARLQTADMARSARIQIPVIPTGSNPCSRDTDPHITARRPSGPASGTSRTPDPRKRGAPIVRLRPLRSKPPLSIAWRCASIS